MSDDTKRVSAFLVALAIAATAFTVVSAHFESKTYNRLTGAKTTWWDAVWVELRVQEQPKDK